MSVDAAAVAGTFAVVGLFAAVLFCEGIAQSNLRWFTRSGGGWKIAVALAAYGLVVLCLLPLFTRFGMGKTVAIWSALSVVVATLLGYLLFRERYSPLNYVGMGVVLSGLIVLIVAEVQHHAREPRAALGLSEPL